MSNTKITQHVIADDAITTSMITDANVTPAKLHGTLDLSSKTLTLPSAAVATTQSASDNSTKLATTAYVETAISNLVDSSPSSLNTLNELAAALNDDASFSTTVTNSLATKAPLANPTFTTAINGGDNVKIQLGASQDLQIYHDGSHSYIDELVTGDLRIRSNSAVALLKSSDNANMLVAIPDGAVTLYHAGSAKLATASYGVDAQGTGALRIPQGTTGQRPTAATGQIRWNTTDGALEVYNGTAWTAVGTGSSNKVLDTFTGDGSTTDFTLSVTPANEDALIVFIDGVYQEKGDYILTNAVLALDTAPASGEKIAVHITTASVHDGTSAVNQQFTATAGQTAFTLSADPKSENNTQVYINGVYQQKTDYTVSGTTLTFDTGLTVGDVVEVNSFTVATLGNSDTVTEGTTNLYHTTARARSAISVSGNALAYNSSTGVLTANFEESPTFTGTVTSANIVSTSNTATEFKNATDTDIKNRFETNSSADYALHRLIGSDGVDNKLVIGYGPNHGSTPNHMALKNVHASGSIGFNTGAASTERIRISSGGDVGIKNSNPQYPLQVHLTSGQIAMFGSNGMNSPGQYAGIGLGQVLANNTTYQKVSLVTEGRNSGSYVQDFHILVDSAADSGKAVLSDSKFKIDGAHGSINMPSQPSFMCYPTNHISQSAGALQTTFGSEAFDRGGNYNTSNGRFTAPVAGRYLFVLQLALQVSTTTQMYHGIGVRVNGIGSVYFGGWASKPTSSNVYDNQSSTIILDLAANDYVESYIELHNADTVLGGSNGALSRWSGQLLS